MRRGGNERETDYSGRQSVSVSVGEAGSAQPVGGGIGVSAGLMTRSGKEGRWREEYNRVGQLKWIAFQCYWDPGNLYRLTQPKTQPPCKRSRGEGGERIRMRAQQSQLTADSRQPSRY